MWNRSVLLKTEVSFGRTAEVSFGFCEKTEVSFFTFFWDRSVFIPSFFTKKSQTVTFSDSTSKKSTQKTTTNNMKIGFQKLKQDSQNSENSPQNSKKNRFGILLGFYSTRIPKKRRVSFLGFWDSSLEFHRSKVSDSKRQTVSQMVIYTTLLIKMRINTF